MTASLIPSPVMQFTDATGAPLVGGKVYTYAAGTTTPLASYTSYAATSSNTNPVILDSRGEAAIWFGNATYKVILKDSTDTLIWTSDNISAVVSMAYVAPGTANNLLQSNGSAWASVAPSTVTVGNATLAAGVPLSGVTGTGTGVTTFLTTPSSANLAAALTDETGTGLAVFATSPTITTATLNSPTMVTPALGTPANGNLSSCTGYPAVGDTLQAYTDVTSSRALNTTYTNSTASPIHVNVQTGASSAVGVMLVNGNNACAYTSGPASWGTYSVIVPPGQTYNLTNASTIYNWYELR